MTDTNLSSSDLAPAIAATIDRFVPRSLDAAQRAAWLADLKAATALVPPTGRDDARAHLSTGARFLADLGADVSEPLSAVLTVERIEPWAARALQSGRNPGAVDGSRVRLEHLRRAVGGTISRRRPARVNRQRPSCDADALEAALEACRANPGALGALVALAGVRRPVDGLAGLGFRAESHGLVAVAPSGSPVAVLAEFDGVADRLDGVVLGEDAWASAQRLLREAGLVTAARTFVASFDIRAFDGRRSFVDAARDVLARGGTRNVFQSIAAAVLTVPAGPFDGAGLRGPAIVGSGETVTVPDSPLRRGAHTGAAMPARPTMTEMRRRAAQEKARRLQVPDLAAEVAAVLDGYRPEGIGADTWAAVQPLHREVIARAQITSAAAATKARAVLAGYLAWRHDQGLAVTLQAVCSIRAIDDYFMRGMADFTLKSRNDYRARLNKLARAANPSVEAPPRVAVGYQKLRPGYTPDEEDQLLRVVLAQGRPTLRRQACAIVGLCGGAGLEPSALRHVRACHIRDRGPDGIAVEVLGSQPRRVMVRRSYEEVVRAAVEGLEPDDLVIGKDPNRRNVTTNVVDKGDFFDDTPRIDASRLRTTWLTWLLHQPVSLRTVLDAAGLRTARSLVEIIEMLPADPAADTARVLRGES